MKRLTPEQKNFMAETGSTMKVLIALMMLGGANVKKKELKVATKFSYPTIREACEALADLGLIVETFPNTYSYLPNGLFSQLPKSEKFFQLSPPSSSRYLIQLKKPLKEYLKTTTTKKNKSEKFFHFSDEQKKVYTLLEEAGVKEPKRSELTEMEHATEDYVRAHLSQDIDTPLKIYRIERKWAKPELIEYCENCNRPKNEAKKNRHDCHVCRDFYYHKK